MPANCYPVLKSTTRLMAESNRVIVFKVDEGENFLSMHPAQAVALACCNGEVERSELEEMIVEVFDFESIEATEFIDYLFEKSAHLIDFYTTKQEQSSRYDPADFMFEPSNIAYSTRLEVPNSVVWIVTNRCPADCVYCVIPTHPANAKVPGELSREQAFKFLQEVVDLGIPYFNFHGGDPFLRKDMPDMIEFLLSHGVFVDVSTKMPLRESLVKRLAEAGLATLQVSIDSHIPKMADAIVRVNNWLPKILQTVRYGQKYQLNVRVNIVVTSLNIKDIPGLIKYLIDKGIKDISMSGYMRSELKHDDSLMLTQPQRLNLAEQVQRIEQQHPEVAISMISLVSTRDASLSTPGLSACGGGKTALVIGSDGNCTTCDRIMPYQDASIGNIKDSSLMELWNGNEINKLLDPSKDSYKETACYYCSEFESCNQRQRCYYRAQLINKNLFTPDYLCPKLPEPPVEIF